MPYLLDGNNLIGLVRRTSRPSEEDRRALCAELAGRLRNTRARVSIFFDGPSGSRSSSLGSLTVRFASGESADDAIVREVSAARAPREMVVVTGDRELARRVRGAGARAVSPPEFFERFGTRHSPSGSGEREGLVDVEAWMRYFEDERNRGGHRTK